MIITYQYLQTSIYFQYPVFYGKKTSFLEKKLWFKNSFFLFGNFCYFDKLRHARNMPKTSASEGRKLNTNKLSTSSSGYKRESLVEIK